MNEFDKYIECIECGHHYKDFCCWCYFLKSPQNEWIKIPKNFDLPSLLNFNVWSPKNQNFIFDVMFCDSCRTQCKKLHVSTKSSAYGNEHLSIKECTHWRKLPADPRGKDLIYDHCCGQHDSEHY